MTQQELAALKALAEAATPGPWWIEGYASMFGVFANNTDEQPETICDLPDDSRYSQNNAAFIAATRAAVPALIAEAERLQVAWSAEHDAYIRADEQARMARREVERLRAELAAARNLTMDVRRADNGDVVISVE